MKEYIGTKIVKAEPMNLGDYNNYRGWTIPEDEDPDREGYLVKYPDDYVSWSPKEIFEEAYVRTENNKLAITAKGMNSKDFKDRFKAEYKQLTIRAEGLSNMLDKMKNGTLEFTPKCSYEILNRQLEYMKDYKGVLEERASIEGINLE